MSSGLYTLRLSYFVLGRLYCRHGGAFRAVYAYSHENYDYWARELGRDDFAIGQFGENFTVEGMLDP